jgi:hypothetical protein
MSDQVIPNDINQFIIEKIESVAQLEALLLLRNNPEKGWSVRALAARLYISDEQTAELLLALCAQGFATIDADNPAVYRFRPSSTELKTTLDRLAEIYAKHLVPVTNLIHSKPKSRIQQFADAFRLRKDK